MDSCLNCVNPYTETIHFFTLVKYTKSTLEECQLPVSYLQLSKKSNTSQHVFFTYSAVANKLAGFL